MQRASMIGGLKFNSVLIMAPMELFLAQWRKSQMPIVSYSPNLINFVLWKYLTASAESVLLRTVGCQEDGGGGGGMEQRITNVL
jgi:hypothetical protein